MKTWKRCCLGLVLTGGLTPAAWALEPPGPGLPPPAPLAALTAPAPPPPAAAPAAPPNNLWSFLCPTLEQKAACKEKLCKTQFGQLFNNSLRPVSAFTGGIIGPTCDNAINPSDLAKPPDSAEGAAARIKAEEADAKARRAAVRYLGTVDCHYWPEARDALINSLRADRNECVRWEAAMALGSGCCCNKDTVRALSLTVAGSDEDGNPSETSERVRAAAAGALEHCLACLGAHPPLAVEAPPPEVGPTPRPLQETPPARPGELPPARPGEAPPAGTTPSSPTAPATRPTTLPPATLGPTAPPATAALPGAAGGDPPGYYRRVLGMDWNRVIGDARQAMMKGGYAPGSANRGTAVAGQGPAPGRPSGHSVMDIITTAFNPPDKAQGPGAEDAAPSPERLAPSAPEQPAAPVSPRREADPGVRPASHSEAAATGWSTPRRPASPYAAVPVPHPRPAGPGAAADSPTAGALGARDSLGSPSEGPDSGSKPLDQAAVTDLLGVLQNDPSAPRRVWAAATLAGLSWRSHPEVVDSLLKVAGQDADPAVRAQCVRALAHMDAGTMAVVNALQVLQADNDQRVKCAAALALAKLSAGPSDGGAGGTGSEGTVPAGGPESSSGPRQEN